MGASRPRIAFSHFQTGGSARVLGGTHAGAIARSDLARAITILNEAAASSGVGENAAIPKLPSAEPSTLCPRPVSPSVSSPQVIPNARPVECIRLYTGRNLLVRTIAGHAEQVSLRSCMRNN
jgi:hypothetical protein